MKKMVTFLLVLSIMLCAVSFSSAEEEKPETFTSGDWTYEVQEDGSAVITNFFHYSNNVSELIIPDKLDGKTVVGIGDYALYGCSNLTTVTIPDSVESIGVSAFYDCSSLTSIVIPEGVTSIDDAAFFGCSSLTSVTIPDSVATLNVNPFIFCNSLSEIVISPDHPSLTVTDGMLLCTTDNRLVSYLAGTASKSCEIPHGVLSIGNYAFHSCSSLTSVTIPESVTSIGDTAFFGCSSLTSVTIPDSVKSIGANPFSSCNKLSKIIVSPNHPSLTNTAGLLLSKPDKRLICCPAGAALKSCKIPQEILAIGSNAFSGCSSLVSVTVPDNVASIGSGAFDNCTSLKSISIPDSITEIEYSTFYNCSSLTSVTLPAGVTSIGDASFAACSSLTSVTIPDSVTSIGNGAFAECSSLKSITIPNGVISIDDYAFTDCTSLTSITIPDSVTSFGEGEFCNCPSLTSVTLPNSVTRIKYATFADCTSLTSVAIPNSIVSIESSAFSNCSSLESIEIPNSVTNIERYVFDECNLLTVAVGHDSYAETYCKDNNINYTYVDNNTLEETTAHMQSPNSNSITDIPSLSDLFPGKEIPLAKLGGNERITLFSGPGTDYTVIRKINPRERNTTTVYFIENDMVFVHYVHRSVDAYAYIVKQAFTADSLEDVPEIDGLAYVSQKTKDVLEPKTGPGDGFEKWPGQDIPQGTDIKCLFTENNHCFIEFETEKGSARAWVVLNNIDVADMAVNDFKPDADIAVNSFKPDSVPAENIIRFDVSEDRYLALWENFTAKWEEGSDDLNHLSTYPVIPESLLRLVSEFNNNSSTLEKVDENFFLWHTEAARIVSDERMLGVNVWVECGSETDRVDIDVREIDWRDGVICISLKDGYRLEDISALRIEYYNGGWILGSGNAGFRLNYSVSDGKVFCDSVEVIMEHYGYCMDWSMFRKEDSDVAYISGFGENLRNDTSRSWDFNAATGEALEGSTEE